MSGVETRFHIDEIADKLHVERIQDVEPILKRNIELANNAPSNWKGEMHHVASIPFVILEDYKNKHGIDLTKREHKKELIRFLNDPANKFLRTKLGRL